MKKILIAENDEINQSLLYEIFAGQYELIQTDSSEKAFRLLTEKRDELSAMICRQELAERFSSQMVQTLGALKVFDRVPILIVLDYGKVMFHPQKLHLPFSDVIASPVNPTVVKKRVRNLVSYFSGKQSMEQMLSDQTRKILDQNRELKEQQKKINTINNDMLDTLSTVIEYRDVESGKHIHRIRKFTEVLLRILAEKYPKYKMTEDKIEMITSASSLHDIGKIAIPDSILLSPRRLTYEEFRIMKQHTIKGCEILEQLEAVEKNEYYRYCYDICRYHHEKWDGTGYPEGLVGDEIPIWAQVVSLADCYDALTSERPYKTAYSHETAVEMIRTGACGAFSDEMMDCFGAALPKMKELAIRYADQSSADHSRKDRRNPTAAQDASREPKKDIYLKMDRNDLIDTIEHQKTILEEYRKRDREVLEKQSDYVIEFDLKNDLLHERKGSMKALCGYQPKNYEESVNILSECCEGEEASRFLQCFRLSSLYNRIREGEERVVLECRMDLQKETQVYARVTAVPLMKGNKIERVYLIICQQHDPETVRFGLDRDAVTGLWNYSGVQHEVDAFLSEAGKNGTHALLMIDIDDFRSVNRQAGYRFGNEILRDISKLLKYQVSEGSILGRIEDDNFVVFLRDCPDKEERRSMIEDLFRCVHRSYLFGNESSPDISASVGISLYPNDGNSFEQLFEKASRAVEVAKLNGKNMYLYYNSGMQENWELKKIDASLKVQEHYEMEALEFKEFFIPIDSSDGEYILSYDMFGMNTSHIPSIPDIENMVDTAVVSGNITALSLSTIRHLLAAVSRLESEKTALPALSVYLIFDSRDSRSVLTALAEMLKTCAVNTENICLMIPHSTVEQFGIADLSDLVGQIKELGFRVGVFQVGVRNININCFIEGLFDRVDFSANFIHGVRDGVYDPELLIGLMKYFEKQGAVCVLPARTDKELLSLLRQRTKSAFGIHKNEMISLTEFKYQMSSPAYEKKYPALSHERSELILNEKLYDEIMVQTRSFIVEWSPRFDTIKLSGSFERLYGYRPETDDFVRDLSEERFIHPDDQKKLIEKMNTARSERIESEAFIRVYSKHDDDYRWNRVHFVTICNAEDIPVRIMAVFTDISDTRKDPTDEDRRDRPDLITKLYNKHSAENKIKSFLYDDGAYGSHAFMIAELCGFEVLERSLGTVFANAVLKETAQSLRELFRDSDIIGRNSGSRFIILVKGLEARQKLLEKAEQICKVICNNYQSDVGEISVFAKIGISVFPHDGMTYDELYSAALRALYYAKHSTKYHIAFASDSQSSPKLLHD